jgi:hypothetical protein
MNQLYNTIASTVGGTSDSRLLSRFRDRSYNTIAPTFTNKINRDADNFTGHP